MRELTGRRVRSLRRIMSLTLIPPIVVGWLLLSAMSYLSVNRVMETKAADGIRYGLEQRMLILNKRLDEMYSAVNNVASISRQRAYSLMSNVSYYRRMEDKREIATIIDSQVTWSQSVGDCLLIDLDEVRLLAGSSYIFRDAITDLLAALEPMVERGQYIFYRPCYWHYENRLAMAVKLTVGPIRNRRNIMILTFSEDSVERLLVDERSQLMQSGFTSGELSLADAHGVPLLSSDDAPEKTVVVCAAPNEWGLSLRYELPEREYYHERDAVLRQTALLALTNITIALCAISLLIRRLNAPIKKTIGAINNIHVTGRIEARREETGIIEYDMILRHIDKADQRIRQDVREILAIEKEKQTQEVMLLRMQINPHFLYNALNAVQWMTRCNETADIEMYVKSLLHILHYNLDSPSEHIVPLHEELSLIRAYVRMHKYRYGNAVQFEVSGDLEQPVMLPRFLLQPLVENALYHGLRNGNGHIGLEVRRHEDMLIIRISDDGCGIPPEILLEIINEKGSGLGIGIRYVNAILKQYPKGKLTIRNIVKENIICGTEAIVQLISLPSGDGS